jgi:hypothetical protein
LAARFAGAGVAATATGAATGVATGAATGVSTATATAFLVTFLEEEAEELMFVLVAGIEFICLKRTGYHIGAQNQSIFIIFIPKNVQFQKFLDFFLKLGHKYDTS